MLIVKFWEAFLKSKATKKRFISLLENNLKQKWIKNIRFKNAYLEIDDKVDPYLVANTFGVYKVEVVEKYDFPQDFDTDELSDEDYASLVLEKIYEKIKSKLTKLVKSGESVKLNSFRVSVTRENKSFPLNSLEIQKILGKLIEEDFNLKADYRSFDLEIKVRILKDSFWFWTNFGELLGLGGLPYGIEWKALNMFSGGIDSPVATFLAAKRGIKQDFLFLNIPGSDLLLQQVYKIYQYLKAKYGINWKFYELRINQQIRQIKQIVPAWTRQIVFKYFLYKISDLLTKYLKMPAIVNWENLGQVSTQTLTNMALLDKVSEKLILRPVLMFDKIEIIDFAKKIWTYDLSIQIKETCSLENHSNSKVKSLEEIQSWYEKLWFDEKQILKGLTEIKQVSNFDFSKLKTDKIKWELVNLDKNCDFKPSKWKIYTFTCSSGYKASQTAYEWNKKGFEVYWI